MWRANVIERISAGRVTVVIPALYRDSPIRDVQAVMDAGVGEDVIIADLNPGSKAHSWLVIGYASDIGRWGDPYPHTHPIGQVDGLVDALDAKADDTDLANYATTAALAGKADIPGEWVNCTISSYITRDNTGAPILSVRNTPLGVQIRGYYRTTSDVPMDAIVFHVPIGFAPSHVLMLNVPTMGPGSTYAALSYQFEIKTNRSVTARQAFTSGARMSFNHIFTL